MPPAAPTGADPQAGAVLEEPPSRLSLFQAPPEYGNPHERAGKPRGIPTIGRAAPDMVVDGADFPGLTVRGASLRGDDHRYNRETRQDSMGLWTLRHPREGDVLLACVADGVGSQPLSHRGSERACRLLREEVEPYVADLLEVDDPPLRNAAARQLIERVAFRMRNHAQDHGMDPKALSTTLVVALVELTSADRPRNCFVFGVGDSAALLLRGYAFRRLWTDKHGDGAISDSGTEALPGHVGSVATAEVRLGGDDVLVICTDGLVNPMRNKEVEKDLVRQWSSGPVPGFLEFAWQLSFRAKSYGDDRTAVCVWGR
jgi:serine/threonine protein phosphatase PrpC